MTPDRPTFLQDLIRHVNGTLRRNRYSTLLSVGEAEAEAKAARLEGSEYRARLYEAMARVLRALDEVT